MEYNYYILLMQIKLSESFQLFHYYTGMSSRDEINQQGIM